MTNPDRPVPAADEAVARFRAVMREWPTMTPADREAMASLAGFIRDATAAVTRALEPAAQAIRMLPAQFLVVDPDDIAAVAAIEASRDVQHEGAGDSAMQRAIRAKRHRNTGPAVRQRGARQVRPTGEWFQL